MRWPKNKKSTEQGSAPNRRVQRSGGVSPAFSYYSNNRGGEPVSARQGMPSGPEPAKRRFASAQFSLWLLVAVGVACFTKVLWLSTNPEVVVIGNNAVSGTYLQSNQVYADAARDLLRSSITNRSKLTANLNGTAREMEREFPELQAVSLGVPLISSRPIVYIQVAQPSVILQTGHGNYALNSSGVVLAKLRSLPADVPLLADQSGGKPEPGKQYLPSSTISFVKTVTYQLKAANITAEVFTQPPQSPYQLDVRLQGAPYYLKFNLQADAMTQSGAAVATIQQLGGSLPAGYIDVRVPGRVYYK